ncbi:MAG: DUF2080 family transposase-associated protein [Candidatus Omnitrophica bacterium]|nr:DUF2080 family transposase-associated protein [Candidatus Omnitrophota bacterium]
MCYNCSGCTIGGQIVSEITIPNAAEMIERTVKPVGGGAQVHVPKTWLGCRVAVVKLEE